MKLTPAQLEADIRGFINHLLEPLREGKAAVVKQQILKDRPLTVRVGMRVPGVDLEAILALARDGSAVRAAWVRQWPANNSGARDAGSVAIAGDEKHVLIDLLFFTLTLETPDALTPAASA